MNSAQIRRILETHAEIGVPLQHTFNFLCLTRGLTAARIATETGYHRSMLYKALAGINPPPERMRAHVRRVFGVDVFSFRANVPRGTKEAP